MKQDDAALATNGRAVARRERGRLALLVVWLAVVTGMLELLFMWLKSVGRDQMLFLHRQTVWMTPLGYALLFGAVTLVAGVVSARAHPLLRRRLTLLALMFTAALSALLVFEPGLHQLAVVCLALGIAVQASRLAAERWDGLGRVVRRSTAVLVGALVVAAGATNAWLHIKERRALASLPPASSGAPNVLLIILDSVRAWSLSAYGYDLPTTPNLARLAREGVRFDRAFSTASWTLPSHGSMFTGRHAYELSADWRRPLDATHRTIAEVLGRAGYRTAGFVANTEFAGYQTGLHRGFARYDDYTVTPGAVIGSVSLARFIASRNRVRRLTGWYQKLGRRPATDVSSAFLNWVARRSAHPFFAFLNFYDAHDPYLPPAGFDTLFDANRRAPGFRERVASVRRAGQPEWTLDRLNYDRSIAYIDHTLGAMLGEIERRGLRQNTLILVTSDHGEALGEHGTQGHGKSLYLPEVLVPLIISWPGRVPEGLSVEAPVSLRDLPATIERLVGLSGTAPLPGKPLTRHWTGDPAAPDTVLAAVSHVPNEIPQAPVAHGDLFSAVVGPWHVIRGGRTQLEVYRYTTDTLERHNLAGSDEVRTLAAGLDSLLAHLAWERGASH